LLFATLTLQPWCLPAVPAPLGQVAGIGAAEHQAPLTRAPQLKLDGARYRLPRAGRDSGV